MRAAGLAIAIAAFCVQMTIDVRAQSPIIIGHRGCSNPEPFSDSNDPVRRQWETDIGRHTLRFGQYPEEAFKQQDRGTVVVSFTVDRSGRLLTSKIERGSGLPVLDREALEMTRRASPFPHPPRELRGDQIDQQISIEFEPRPGGLVRCPPDTLLPPVKLVVDVTETRGMQLTLDEKTSLRKQLVACWKSEPKQRISFRLRLDRDGALADFPSVENRTQGHSDAIAIVARADIAKCGPFRLPAETYESWREIIVTFSPGAPQLDKETKAAQPKAQKRRRQ